MKLLYKFVELVLKLSLMVLSETSTKKVNTWRSVLIFFTTSRFLILY